MRGEKKQNIPFFLYNIRGEKRERGRELQLLSTIYGDRVVEIHRAKSESSSTRQGLCVGTKKEEFHRRSKGGYFVK